jgi:tungstate transport system substrate-binding protein
LFSSKTHFKRLSILGLSLVLVMMVLMLSVGCSSTPAASSAPVTKQLPPITSNPPQNTASSQASPASLTPTRTSNNKEIIMASTTSTRDSGLMDVLIPIFQQKSGYQLKPIYVGSGAAMTMGQQGNADVLLVHSPAAEVTFMQGGYGINRRLVMHNDYIIVGPASDPAGIKGMTSAVDALKKIAAAKTNFYSRGDNSGTDALEKSLWTKAGVTVKDGATTNPGWYIEGGTGAGMLDLLRIASEKNGYTITDRSTYVANQKILAVVILVEKDPVLLNVYHVIQVNPSKFPIVNAAGAQAFSDFMVAPDTQAEIAKYGVAQYGQQLFFPDAGKTEAELGSQ